MVYFHIFAEIGGWFNEESDEKSNGDRHKNFAYYHYVKFKALCGKILEPVP
jgi:hypothetical protein